MRDKDQESAQRRDGKFLEEIFLRDERMQNAISGRHGTRGRIINRYIKVKRKGKGRYEMR